jgi:predicted RNA-binding Zn-ribbon protein involved in translation (DUF1610 family)
MVEKMTCSSCGSHTSGVLEAFRNDWPCPICGLPAHAAEAVVKARQYHVAKETIKRLATVETQLAQVLAENQRLRASIEAAKAALS